MNEILPPGRVKSYYNRRMYMRRIKEFVPKPSYVDFLVEPRLTFGWVVVMLPSGWQESGSPKNNEKPIKAKQKKCVEREWIIRKDIRNK